MRPDAIRNRLIDKLKDLREALDEIHLPQLETAEENEEGGILSFLFGSVWRVLLFVIAGLIVAFFSSNLSWV